MLFVCLFLLLLLHSLHGDVELLNDGVADADVRSILGDVDARDDARHTIVHVDDDYVAQTEAAEEAKYARQVGVLGERVRRQVHVGPQVEQTRALLGTHRDRAQTHVARIRAAEVVRRQLARVRQVRLALEQREQLMAQNEALEDAEVLALVRRRHVVFSALRRRAVAIVDHRKAVIVVRHKHVVYVAGRLHFAQHLDRPRHDVEGAQLFGQRRRTIHSNSIKIILISGKIN